VVKARKRFAQHFLEPAWVGKLIGAIAPQAGDVFIEIGPGRGAITEPLAARVAQLVVVEVDRDLAAALESRHLPNVAVVNADVLDVDLGAVAADATSAAARAAAGPDHAAPSARVRVAGNLPYNISSPILFKLLSASASGRFRDAHLMLQKEVADRLVAEVGSGDYGVLTISTQLRADVTRVLALPPGAFRPAPSVHSAVVRFDFRPPPPDVADPEHVVTLVRSVFTQRRKTIANALMPFASSVGANARELLRQAAIDPRLRPQNLTLADFARLSRACAIVSP
jgi:16S rRNA (adenine1518-N6/adenine1519-N6)-dimethyltransferase